jgi:hypothetical protein
MKTIVDSRSLKGISLTDFEVARSREEGEGECLYFASSHMLVSKIKPCMSESTRYDPQETPQVRERNLGGAPRSSPERGEGRKEKEKEKEEKEEAKYHVGGCFIFDLTQNGNSLLWRSLYPCP